MKLIIIKKEMKKKKKKPKEEEPLKKTKVIGDKKTKKPKEQEEPEEPEEPEEIEIIEEIEEEPKKVRRIKIIRDKSDFDLEEGNHKDRMGTLKIKNSKDNNYNNKHDEIEDDDINIDTDIGK